MRKFWQKTKDWFKRKCNWLKVVIIGGVATAAIFTGIGLAPNDLPIDRLDLYSHNSKTVQNPDGSLTTDFRIKWINYLDTDGSWKEINPSFASTSDGFVMNKAPFKVKVPLISSGVATFLNDNRWDVFDKKLIDEPELTQTIQALGVVDVFGKIKVGDLGFGTTSYVVYEGAYPSLNADLIYWVWQGVAPRLVKLVRFNSNPNLLADTNVDFKISYDKPIYIQRLISDKKVGWTRRSPILNYQGDVTTKVTGSRFVNDETKMRGIGMKPFKIWDSATLSTTSLNSIRKTELVRVNITPTAGNDNFILSKIIPADFFIDVVYPVYTDTTSTFFPDANVETNTVDGEPSANSASNVWNTVHDQADGDSAPDSNTSIRTNAGRDGGGEYEIYRPITLFDTSSIPDTDTIDSATTSLYVTTTINQDNDGDDFIVMATSSPASTTAIAVGDYDAVGDVDGMIEISSRIDISGVSTGAYNDWLMTSTAGHDTIDKTGITKIGNREGHDVLDFEFAAGTPIRNLIDWNSADTSGTSTDPKLEVTHSASAVRKVIFISWLDFLINKVLAYY